MSSVILSKYVTPILLKTDEASCNCSLFSHSNKTYLISREVSYYTCDTCGFTMKGKYHTTNHLYEIDANYNVKKVKVLSAPFNSGLSYVYNGLEDIRTIEWNGYVYFLCTKVLGNSDKGVMCYGRIIDLSLCDLKEIPTSCRREKNWMPIEIEPFNCIYNTQPYLKINLKTKQLVNLSGFSNKFSGSSAVVKYKDNKLISLVHTKDSKCRYTHYFVIYDENLKPLQVSQPFSFFGNRTEFCCSLKVTDTGVVVIPSVNDGVSYVFDISMEFLSKLFNGELLVGERDPNLYDKLYVDAKTINAMEVAVTAACLALNKSYIAEAIMYNHNVSGLDLRSKIRRQHILLANFHT